MRSHTAGPLLLSLYTFQTKVIRRFFFHTATAADQRLIDSICHRKRGLYDTTIQEEGPNTIRQAQDATVPGNSPTASDWHMGCDFKPGGCRELQKPPLVERLLSCLSELFDRARAQHTKNSMVLSYAALAIASSLPSDEVSAINTRASFPLRLREPRWTGTSRGSECWESKCDTRSNAIVTVTLQIQMRFVLGLWPYFN